MNKMMNSKLGKPFLGILAIVVISLIAIYPALAAPPSNDDIANATIIPGVPFSDATNTSEATVAPDDPWPWCNGTGVRQATVWYSFTPATDMQVTASTAGSSYTTNLAVYPSGSISETACTVGNNPISFQVTAGQPYSIMIAAVDGGPYPPPGGYGGSLNFTLHNPGPPQVYFNYSLEQWYGLYAYYFSNQSYDPAGAGMTAYWDFGDGTTSTDWSLYHQFPSEGVYQVTLTVTTFDGRSASTQQEVTVTPPPPALPPVADFFYYPSDIYTNIQVQFYNSSWDPGYFGMYANWDFGYGTTSNDWSPSYQYPVEGTYEVTLTVTTYDGRAASTTKTLTVIPPPPPVAEFYTNPFDPSTYDTVQFDNMSYDPSCYWCYGMSASWNFGDGTTSTSWSPSHRYAAEGDYTVSLAVTTGDGRTASTTWTLQVRTHDVAITRFTVPQSAKAGQTRSVSVDVNNTRYPEQVEVQLYKSTAGGWQWVGTLQQYVPVRPSNRTTRFEFSYTFTAEDALLGRINFRAVAVIVNGRDALPTNNEAISLPTKVAQ